jgi:hypothetical protein
MLQTSLHVNITINFQLQGTSKYLLFFIIGSRFRKWEKNEYVCLHVTKYHHSFFFSPILRFPFSGTTSVGYVLKSTKKYCLPFLASTTSRTVVTAPTAVFGWIIVEVGVDLIVCTEGCGVRTVCSTGHVTHGTCGMPRDPQTLQRLDNVGWHPRAA